MSASLVTINVAEAPPGALGVNFMVMVICLFLGNTVFVPLWVNVGDPMSAML